MGENEVDLFLWMNVNYINEAGTWVARTGWEHGERRLMQSQGAHAHKTGLHLALNEFWVGKPVDLVKKPMTQLNVSGQ